MSKVTKAKYDNTLKKLEMDIMIGTYKPRERLIESEIMEKYGITRNAVRNIFRELQNKGFVRHIPNRGVLVAEMETEDATDLYSMRLLLENHAADLISKNIIDSDLGDIVEAGHKFEKAIQSKDFNEMMAANIEFHDAIFKISGNSILTEMIRQLRSRAVAIRHYTWLHPEHLQKSVAEHAVLIDALKRKDTAKFKKINRVHILAALEMYTGEKYADARTL